MFASGSSREMWDRVVASDPGLHRLRMALSVGVAMSTTIAVEYGFARLTHASSQGLVVAILLGTVIAMMGSMALGGSQVWPKVRTAVFFPVAIAAGMLPGALVVGHTAVTLVLFVLVMALAVFIRRFGPAFFFYGFMMWLGYFFTIFLGAELSEVPSLLAAVAVSTVWNLLLAITLLRTHPRRTLSRVQRAFGARARAVAGVCAELLETRPDEQARRTQLRRTLHSRQLRLAETALIVDGWSGEPGALPAGWSAPALRRRLLDAHLLIDEMAAATESLIAAEGRPAESAAVVARHLGRREYQAAAQRARELLARDQLDGDCFAQHLASAALGYTALAAQGDIPPEADDAEEFNPAAALALGGLPKSGAIAADVAGRGWNRLGRLSLTSRQTVQVTVAGGLAIIIGRELSETRYYWAVLAAFIAFAGTATRAETTIKAWNRVLGTLLGLGVGVGFVHLTAGHTLWMLVVVVASMTLGFYVVNVSYAGMIFFVTVMVAQLYSQLHEYSAGLLVMRLSETALGAVIGIAVALLVLPTSTRDTTDMARQRYFTALTDLLRAAADRFEGAPPRDTEAGSDLDALTRIVDLRMQQLALVTRPLTHSAIRPLIRGNNPHAVRRRLTSFAALTQQGRALALEARDSRLLPDPAASQACTELAAAAEFLAETQPDSRTPAPEVAAHLASAEASLLSRPPKGVDALPTVARPLTQLPRLLGEFAVLPGSAPPPLSAAVSGATGTRSEPDDS